jgi:hypothetical protein
MPHDLPRRLTAGDRGQDEALVITRITESRVTRMNTDMIRMPSDTVGSVITRMLPQGSCQNGTYPPTRSPSDQYEKMKMSAVAITDSGTLMPNAPSRRTGGALLSAPGGHGGEHTQRHTQCDPDREADDGDLGGCG